MGSLYLGSLPLLGSLYLGSLYLGSLHLLGVGSLPDAMARTWEESCLCHVVARLRAKGDRLRGTG